MMAPWAIYFKLEDLSLKLYPSLPPASALCHHGLVLLEVFASVGREGGGDER
jgi:hypothetical protein